jgi:bifunctional DNA-binding transcriptional regulator/antitoxin component of YhaV-PrlF toxin-antitoxin module
MDNLRELLKISEDRLGEVNDFLTDPDNETVNQILAIVEKYGGPREINRKAAEAGKFDNLMARLREIDSPYVAEVEWLTEQRQKGTFVSMAEYYDRVLGKREAGTTINQDNAVTLEISALQFFPWLIAEAKQAIKNKELMPGRYIRVRNMKEQTEDNGDILATAAAVQIVGATHVETLDTKGTDGSNIHLGGPGTITGYFGGIGQPNEYPCKWIDEYLHYYTTYGVRQVLNINAGTIMAAYMLHKLGVDNEFKISVFMGNDNPLAIFWTLMAARLFARKDGSTSLIGFNLSNSVDNGTIRQAAKIRRALGLEKQVRFEHHITETQKSIVIQPYNRRDELVEVAREVSNIAAKHEGGDPEVDAAREHPTDILDYFLPKDDILSQGLMAALERNYLDKHDAVNRTAEALVKAGIGVVCAWHLHK